MQTSALTITLAPDLDVRLSSAVQDVARIRGCLRYGVTVAIHVAGTSCTGRCCCKSCAHEPDTSQESPNTPGMQEAVNELRAKQADALKTADERSMMIPRE